MGMNLVVLTGRLTADPELKYTQSGKAFARFTVAVNRTFNRDQVDFINCVAWDKRAEIIAEYMRKGSQAGVQGRLTVRSYDDENGQKRKVTEVVVENLEFLDSKKTSGSDVNYSSQSSSFEGQNVDDDEFPF